jgi:predicted Zn-dependent protease
LKPGFNVYSKDQDVELGKAAAQEVRKQVEIVNNQELQSYISRLGHRLSSVPQAEDYPYTFTLVNDSSINAFALPGGPVFVHIGLLKAADNEAQLVGVLAHEISHVALRHATSEASKATLVQLPAVVAGQAIGQESTIAQLGQLGLGLGVNSVLLKYSRDAEREADALGTQIMSQAGYNPLEMARFFEKLEAEGGARAPEFLSSHPNPGNRVSAVRAEIATMQQRDYRADTGQFPRMRQLAGQLPPPKQSAQNTVFSTRPSAQPSPLVSRELWAH